MHVCPVFPCLLRLQEWDRIGPRDALSKMLYLQSKLDKRMAALAQATADSSGAAASGAAQAGAQAQSMGATATAAANQLVSVSSMMSIDGGDLPVMSVTSQPAPGSGAGASDDVMAPKRGRSDRPAPKPIRGDQN
jgi:hypothetical protein